MKLSVRAGAIWSSFATALTDLLLQFWPLLPPLLAHQLFGNTNDYFLGPDILMLNAVLFADGWWRVRKIRVPAEEDRDRMELFGLLGAVLTSILGFVLVANNLKAFVPTFHATGNAFLGYCRITALLGSFIYAVAVRMMEKPPSKYVRQVGRPRAQTSSHCHCVASLRE